MNPLFQFLERPEWELIVRTLAHSIWQGALLAGALGWITRRVANPVVRYRCAVTALAFALMAAVLTWAVIGNSGVPKTRGSAVASGGQSASLTQSSAFEQTPSRDAGSVFYQPAQATASVPMRATALLALLWLSGAAAMLVRAGIKVAGAETLRRSCQSPTDPALSKILGDARRAIGITRQVRLAVTDRLTSPVVVGWLVPTLILPLALVTTMTPEQIRFILLHELAHVRRGDYLVNLFQLLVESVFFFNPAIWWISRQIRREREACCDALASRLGGEPVEYARTLIEAAERGLEPTLAAAPALGERQPSILTERVRRILMPDYRPAMRLTWRAVVTCLVVGSALLMLSAVGAKVAVAAIMTPQQRIERIEKKMAEYGQNPRGIPSQNGDRVTVVVRIKTPDGSSSTAKKNLIFHSFGDRVSGSYGGMFWLDRTITNTVPRGQIWIEAFVEGYAPAIAGPFDGTLTNRIDVGDLVLTPGFDVSLQVVDSKTGQPIPGVRLLSLFWLRNTGSNSHSSQKRDELTADAFGRASLVHCADYPLAVTACAPGYEMREQRFEHVRAGEVLVIKLDPGATIEGKIIDKISGAPVVRASVRVLNEKGPTSAHYEWDDPLRVVAQTDSAGRFAANQFRRDTVYWLGFSAPGYESAMLGPVAASATNLIVRLGPELIVRGRVIGDLSRFSTERGKPTLNCNWTETIETHSWGHVSQVPCWDDNGVTRFQFTQPVAARVIVNTKDGQEFERMVDAPVNDWVIDLTTPKPSPTNTPQREVIFRFKYPAGVPPQGTVSVTVPDSLEPGHHTAHDSILQITNGQVSFQASIGGYAGIEPKRLPGFWFGRIWSIQVTNGSGPMVVEVPVLAAGAIYARSVRQDGSGAWAFLGVEEIERAPGRRVGSLSASDSASTQSSRWASGPLPLGSVYQVYAYRDRTFVLSKRIKLTEQQPDAEVELRLPEGKTLTGILLDPDRKPIPNVGLELTFHLGESHSFGLHSVFTDGQGRFQVTGATPEAGRYSVLASVPGLRAEQFDLDGGSALQTLRLTKGLTISGQLIEGNTGRVIPNAEIRAWTFDKLRSPQWPSQQATTDAQGRFQFTTLADSKYSFYVSGGQVQNQREVNPAVTTNHTISIKLEPGSELKPTPEQ